MVRKVLSICIPTWNRARVLERTLDNIISQALEFRDKVEICISNNASTDNTREIVMRFKEKYPDLMRYNENEDNLGFDKNLLRVVNIAEARFAWTFGDYSFIVDGGLKDVINYLESIDDGTVGLVGVRQEGYIINENDNNKQIVYTTVDKNKPHVIKIKVENMHDIPPLRGVTHVILNTKLIKKIYREEPGLVEMGVGALYMHSWLYYIMFILNKNLECHVINKVIVSTPYSLPGHFIEDYFILVLNGDIRFNGMLESICMERGENDFANFFGKMKKSAKLDFYYGMVRFKILDEFMYGSYFGCLKLFTNNLKFKDAILSSISFSMISLTPRSILKIIAKLYIKIRCGKKAASSWNEITKPIPIDQSGVSRTYSSKQWRGEDRIQSKF